jgi:hypothetical protein
MPTDALFFDGLMAHVQTPYYAVRSLVDVGRARRLTGRCRTATWPRGCAARRQ